MIKNISGISLILPTLNEGENLAILIPEIIEMFLSLKYEKYEILVMDDGSNDSTVDILNNLNKENKRINLINRKNEPSLPMAIYEGIEVSKYEYVMWLDADGSMPVETIELLIQEIETKPNSAIIGSRFAEGGGYKGVKDLGRFSFLKAVKNVNKSKDSVSGMILSILFNKLLNFVFGFQIQDITSGFIILPKNYISKESFQRTSYGEYFIYLINDLLKRKIDIVEVGYICKTRIHGESKTASSISQLIQRGIPYIVAARISRKERNENI